MLHTCYREKRELIQSLMVIAAEILVITRLLRGKL